MCSIHNLHATTTELALYRIPPTHGFTRTEGAQSTTSGCDTSIVTNVRSLARRSGAPKAITQHSGRRTPSVICMLLTQTSPSTSMTLNSRPSYAMDTLPKDRCRKLTRGLSVFNSKTLSPMTKAARCRPRSNTRSARSRTWDTSGLHFGLALRQESRSRTSSSSSHGAIARKPPVAFLHLLGWGGVVRSSRGSDLPDMSACAVTPIA